MNTIEKDGKTFYVSDDGKEYKSRSGAWKRNKRIDSKGGVESDSQPPPIVDETPSTDDETLPPPTSTEEPSHDEDEGSTDTSNEWMNFNLGVDDEATDVIPAPLRMITGQDLEKNRKRTAKELKAIKNTELAILKMGLSGIDTVLTAYGKSVCLDDSFTVKHSDSSKDIVANAQAAWLEEKGIFLTNYLSKGVVAGTLTGWYIGAPLLRIKRKAKKPMLKRLGGGFLARLPLIGRWFKPKKENTFQMPLEGEFNV